jgi:hypothetical protein
VAVTVAVWSRAIVPAVAVKLAVVLPLVSVTEAGTVSAAASLDSEIEVATATAWFMVTVQFDDWEPLNDVGLQLSALSCGQTAVTMPPEPLIGRDVPLAEAPSVLVTPIVVLLTVGASVTVTAATTPFCITVELSPAIMQGTDPALGLQVSDLPAFVALVPAAKLTATMSLGL